jgi:predicted nucleic acid-binding protein
MKKILVDINIILDFLNKRNFYELAKQIIQLCSDKKIQGYFCKIENSLLGTSRFFSEPLIITHTQR